MPQAQDITDFFGPVIHSYTRKEAIEDGFLVELPNDTATEAGFKCPVAITRAAWTEAIELTPTAEEMGCDIEGRTWDVLWMLMCGIRHGDLSGDRGFFELYVVKDKREPTLTKLKIMVGPGDEGEMVMTVMLPHED